MFIMLALLQKVSCFDYIGISNWKYGGTIYIYIYIFRKKWVESDRMYVEKVKRKKNIFAVICLFANAFRLFECKSVLSKLF